jgi:outer membrane biosynthesis protein TonB
VESTVELLAKTGLTIIGSVETHGAVETAVEIAEAGESVSEMIASATKEQFDERALSATLKALGTHVTKALVGAMGVHEAAKKFGDNIAQIIAGENDLKNTMESWDKAYKDLQRIDRLQQNCKGDKTEPEKKEEPKTDQTPEPTKPTPPKKPEPKTETPPAKEQPTEEPTPQEPGDEEPPVSPPPPTSEPRQVGLPYSPSECGCNSSKGLTVSPEGFAAIGTGMKNLGDCVDKFNTVTLADYQQALQKMSEMSDSLTVAANSGPAEFMVKAKEAKPQLDALIKRTKSYDEAGRTFLKQVEKCPDSVSAGMDVLKSATTVTVDSITTKY